MATSSPQRPSPSIVRWVLIIVVALAIVALLALARGTPGAGGRVPPKDDAATAELRV